MAERCHWSPLHASYNFSKMLNQTGRRRTASVTQMANADTGRCKRRIETKVRIVLYELTQCIEMMNLQLRSTTPCATSRKTEVALQH